MSSDIKEYPVTEYDHGRKVMYFAKEMLLKEEKINLVASTKSSPIASRAAETLVRLGYVTFENIQTLTEIKNDRRVIRLIITLKRTANFNKLYEENQKYKKEREEEREKESKEATKKK